MIANGHETVRMSSIRMLQSLRILAGSMLLAFAQSSVNSSAQNPTAKPPSPPGQKLYSMHCAGCHGKSGDGKGQVAGMLYPRPRDFVAADYKFSSRPTPGLPTDPDLMRVLTRGLKGTAMPSFHDLPETELRELIGYLKTLSPRWKEEQPDPIEIPEDPWKDKMSEAIAEGDRIYHVEATCQSCHPAYHAEAELNSMTKASGYEPSELRQDAHLSIPQVNADGSRTMPPDFVRDWIKTGADTRNLYRVIAAGITTTAMPTWEGAFEPEQIWALAHYISSLAEKRPFAVRYDYQPRPPFDPFAAPSDAPKAETFHEK